MAYDVARQVVLLFGGPLSEPSHTWVWDGKKWGRLQPPIEPPIDSPKAGATLSWPMAYDEARQNVVLVAIHPAGVDGPPSVPPDTWTWDGHTWTLHQGATLPPVVRGGSVAYDGTTGRLLLLSSMMGPSRTQVIGTWTWSGTSWEQQRPATLPPSVGPMAYDSARRRLVLLIPLPTPNPPTTETQTWTWDGTTWTQQQPASAPPATVGGSTSLAYDSARGLVVTFGGLLRASEPLDGTWTWDGTTWTRQQPASRPPGRFNHTMVYDGAIRQVVMTGGTSLTAQGSISTFSDTWTWDGATWTQR